MDESSYKREKMMAGVELLATGRGELRERLEGLYPTTLMRLKPDDFEDSDQRALFEGVHSAITREPGSVAASIAAMDEITAKKVAADFFELFLRVFRVQPYDE
ncbi:MAG TPA: hypothetical protein VNZ01_10225 [Solirubrobacteraceae bacterium]|jgi:hypothetical protein|nr:hypothetical protein [Solirubrobacteraceae bacterium]